MLEFKNIILSKEEGIALLTVNRPKQLNAFNVETCREIEVAFADMRDDAEIQVVIVTGAGEKSFVAGADIAEIKELNTLTGKQFAENGQKMMSAIENFPKPVIAVVNGFALGGGTEFALACHIRLASANAKMGLPEVTLGVIPGYGGTQRLARLIGKGRALELILTGAVINAEEAYRLGLVNKIVEQAELLETAKKMAKDIMKNGPVAVRAALEAVTKGCETTLEQGLALEANLFGIICSTEDKTEGTSAFLEKRKAEFKNL